MTFNQLTSRSRFALAAVVASCCVVQANASPINYGDFDGVTVMYLDVTETANTPDDEEPLYGPPSIAANQLDFHPAKFSASAINGSGDPTDGQLNITLMSSKKTPNVINAITSFTITEGGDYSLLGTGTAATKINYAVSVGAASVVEVDGVTLPSPISLLGASASGSDHLGNGSDSLTPWSLSLAYDVNAALAAANVPFVAGATKLELAFDDGLVAFSEAQSSAFIAKKSFTIDTVTRPYVPEPSSLVLVLLGLGGMGLAFRRRR